MALSSITGPDYGGLMRALMIDYSRRAR